MLAAVIKIRQQFQLMDIFKIMQPHSLYDFVQIVYFYTQPHNSGGVLYTIVVGYGFTLDVRVSVGPSVVHLSIRPSIRFSFPDDTLSKHQWIFTKLGMCIDIKEIWFGIANGQISSNFYGVICPRHAHIFISGL